MVRVVYDRFVLGKGGEDGEGMGPRGLVGFFSRSVIKTARECWAHNRRHIKHKRHTSPTAPAPRMACHHYRERAGVGERREREAVLRPRNDDTGVY